jgi:hypothetical protein
MKKETGTKILWALTLFNAVILFSMIIVWACRHHGHHGREHYGGSHHQGAHGSHNSIHQSGYHHQKESQPIPELTGTWSGTNHTVSDLKGFKEWEKTIHITEQRDRRFKGHFTYVDGTKHFSGIIYPGNISFSWVSSDSKGYNHGRILGPDTITACYVEALEQSTAGCAELTRQDDGE